MITWTESDNVIALYIDGVKDDIELPEEGVAPLVAPEQTYVMNTTIGGIRRAAATHQWTGVIDEVAMWERQLTPEEVMEVFTEKEEQAQQPLMDKDEAVALLLELANVDEADYLKDNPSSAWPPQAACTIAAECGLLPVTLTIAAQVMRSGC